MIPQLRRPALPTRGDCARRAVIWSLILRTIENGQLRLARRAKQSLCRLNRLMRIDAACTGKFVVDF